MKCYLVIKMNELKLLAINGDISCILFSTFRICSTVLALEFPVCYGLCFF